MTGTTLRASALCILCYLLATPLNPALAARSEGTLTELDAPAAPRCTPPLSNGERVTDLTYWRRQFSATLRWDGGTLKLGKEHVILPPQASTSSTGEQRAARTRIFVSFFDLAAGRAPVKLLLDRENKTVMVAIARATEDGCVSTIRTFAYKDHLLSEPGE